MADDRDDPAKLIRDALGIESGDGANCGFIHTPSREVVRGVSSGGCVPPTIFSADKICATISCGRGSIETMIGFSSGPGSSSASN